MNLSGLRIVRREDARHARDQHKIADDRGPRLVAAADSPCVPDAMRRGDVAAAARLQREGVARESTHDVEQAVRIHRHRLATADEAAAEPEFAARCGIVGMDAGFAAEYEFT